MDPSPSRRRMLRAAAAGSIAGLAGCQTLGGDAVSPGGRAPTTGDGTGAPLPDGVGLETVATGFEAPVAIAFAPDADRRYVADQTGRIFVHGPDGLREEPFLDLGDAVEVGGEKGLLGLALHPEFADNRRLFVRYSAPPRSATPSNYSHTFVLAEFTATDDGRRVRSGSERPLLEIPEPQSNHNAGSVAFGPDGYLYVGVGDGGGGGDRGTGHVDDWYDPAPGGNGQDVAANLLGSLLRIDVDDRTGDRAYGIPEDNPLIGRPGRDEHYAWGFRNPWRLSFDGESLFVGDVGQSAYEEVDLVERGGNYGWNVKEGAHCYGARQCPDATPDSVRGGEPLRDPIVEYPHSGGAVSGISVIGGYVYRGSALPGLRGRYVFGDLNADGRLFVATPPDGALDPGRGTDAGGDGGGGTAADADSLWPTRALSLADADAGKLQRLLSFGRDPAGEVYALGVGADGGGVYRLAPTG